MTVQDQIKALKDLNKDKAKFIEDALSELEGEISKGQQRLFDQLIKEVAGKLRTDKDGNILFSNSNVNAADEVNRVFDKFQRSYLDDMIAGFSSKLRQLAVYTEEFYSLYSPAKSTIENITSKIDLLYKTLGMDAKGKVLQDSYLSKLSNAAEVRETLRDYVLNNVSSGRSYDQFLNGFSELVKGSDEVNGEMLRYYKTYAWDTFNKVDQTERNIVGDQLDLNYFIYNGDTIDKTRPFCEERAGQVFSREEGENWNTEDWAGKDDSADFFVNRGGYNCRHTIDWISNEMACYLNPELCEEAGIDPETFEDVE